MRKFIGKIIILCACLSVAASPAFATNKNSAEADGIAEIAMELESGTVFHGKNENQRLPMASTTKIMTALIVAEECDLSEIIEVPAQAVGVEGSSIYLKEGERISVKDLLYGLMLRSGNDAASALALHCGGTIENFVNLMNERAKEIGALGTHFANPSGLPDDSHYTTAKDLCNIARVAMSNPVFSEVVSTKTYRGDFRCFVNKNKLLSNLDGANGVKTGYTEKAGRCLVSSAKRGNMDVVCVVLNCYDMFERSKKIIEDCFNFYDVLTVEADKIFTFNGKLCALKEDCNVIVKRAAEIDYKISAPKQGDEKGAVANLKIYCEKDLIFSRNLFTIN